MKYYNAPEGYVFDYKEPRKVTIIDEDGSKIYTEEHLYANSLALGMFDSLEDNYKLVPDPRKQTGEGK